VKNVLYMVVTVEVTENSCQKADCHICC